jgi:hypothetical protein
MGKNLSHPDLGDDGDVHRPHAAELAGASEDRTDEPLMTPRTYEITFAGEAVPAVVEAFEDFDITVDAGSTTLRADRVDQAALHGAIDRLGALGLELLEVRAV